MLRFADICECWILVRLSYLLVESNLVQTFGETKSNTPGQPRAREAVRFSAWIWMWRAIRFRRCLELRRCVHHGVMQKTYKEPWETHSIIIHRVQGVYAFFGSMFAMLGCAGSSPVHLLHSVPQWQCYSQMGALVQRRRLVHGMSIKFDRECFAEWCDHSIAQAFCLSYASWVLKDSWR